MRHVVGVENKCVSLTVQKFIIHVENNKGDSGSELEEVDSENEDFLYRHFSEDD